MVRQFSSNQVQDAVKQIPHHDGCRDHDWLSDLQAVDSGQNVDGVRAEDCQHAHVDVVQEPKVDVGAENGSGRIKKF